MTSLHVRRVARWMHLCESMSNLRSFEERLLELQQSNRHRRAWKTYGARRQKAPHALEHM
eukprot:4335861-Amphidinium_carterae.1